MRGRPDRVVAYHLRRERVAVHDVGRDIDDLVERTKLIWFGLRTWRVRRAGGSALKGHCDLLLHHELPPLSRIDKSVRTNADVFHPELQILLRRSPSRSLQRREQLGPEGAVAVRRTQLAVCLVQIDQPAPLLSGTKCLGPCLEGSDGALSTEEGG